MTSTGDVGAPTATDAVALVRAFLEALGETSAGNIAAFEQYMAPDVEWDTGSRLLHSLQESIDHMRAMPEEYGVEAFRVNVKHIAGNDRVVLTERVDDLIKVGGGVLHETKVMGTFEVDGGKITAWRDYYDTAGLARDLAALRSGEA